MNSQELQGRLSKFSVSIIKLVQEMNSDIPSRILANQLMRSGTSVSLNYGEARPDYIHIMRIVLKELRESSVCLELIRDSGIYPKESTLTYMINENDELIAIIFTSIRSAQQKSSAT